MQSAGCGEIISSNELPNLLHFPLENYRRRRQQQEEGN